MMRSLIAAVSKSHLAAISPPETLALGQQLTGLVSLHALGPKGATASVEAADVQLRFEGQQLRWSCTCLSSRHGRCCEHCVATAFAVRREMLVRG